MTIAAGTHAGRDRADLSIRGCCDDHSESSSGFTVVAGAANPGYVQAGATGTRTLATRSTRLRNCGCVPVRRHASDHPSASTRFQLAMFQ